MSDRQCLIVGEGERANLVQRSPLFLHKMYGFFQMLVETKVMEDGRQFVDV